eukprot:gene12938-13038_t
MSSRARIYRKPKTSMQSGPAGRDWILEFAPAMKRVADPLMGWTGSGDTQSQIRLHFETREEAIAYATRENIPYDAEIEVPPRERKPKSYADNFKFGRFENWTH